MTAVSRLFIRTALLSFLLGMLGGSAFLLYKAATGQQAPPALIVIHTHLLTVGFLVNMVIGVAYWMFPRPSGIPARDVPALVMYWGLNGGLLLRFVTESFAEPVGSELFRLGLALSAVFQATASIIFVGIIWGRVMSPRARLEREQARGKRPPTED